MATEQTRLRADRTKSKEESQKTQLLRELEQLEHKVSNLERELSNQLFSKKSDFRKEFIALEETENRMTVERKAEKDRVKQQLKKMGRSVDKFQRELQNVKPTPEFVEKLKESMEEIETVISSYKEKQRHQYEELLREELDSWQEVQSAEKKFESWSQAPPSLSARRLPPALTSATSTNVRANLPPEVVHFEQFVEQNGGHRGGWDEYDHQTFLRIRSKHKSKSAFVDAAVSSLPGRSLAEVRAHEKWYQEYANLLEIKKEAIQQWREKRENEKEEFMLKASENKNNEKDEKKKHLSQKLLEEEKREKLTKLNAWKVQKELERMQEEERQMQEELRKAKQMDKEQQRKLAVRAQAEEYQRQRREKEERERMEKEIELETERRLRSKTAPNFIARFQVRDQRALEEKRSRSLAKEMEEERKMRILAKQKEQAEINVKRDPNRLYKLTEGWKERKKEGQTSSSGPVLHIPHRAVPSWRSGV